MFNLGRITTFAAAVFGYVVFVTLISINFLSIGLADTLSGTLPGQFKVSASGAANYAVPVAVPKGVGGLQPQLRLSYSSSSGNGDMGIGWGLSGLSSITRCGRSTLPDGEIRGVNFTSEDRFCLDGQRLFSINGDYGADGTEYRTEIEEYSKIISYGVEGSDTTAQPVWFEVQDRSGIIYEYGRTDDSSIEAVGADGTVSSNTRAWALSKTADRSGNAMSYSYVEDQTNGSYRLEKITYGANSVSGSTSTASVEFVFETRTDTNSSYYAGMKVGLDKRLTNVHVKNNNPSIGDQLIYDYQLTYDYDGVSDQSRLLTIAKCTASGDCLTETAFDWQDGPADLASHYSTREDISSYPGLHQSFWAADKRVLKVLDINGDGTSDVLLQSRNATDDTFVLLGQRGKADPVMTLVATDMYQMDKERWRADKRKAIVLDFNGDGKQDILLQGIKNGDNSYLLAGTEDGFADAVALTLPNFTGDKVVLHILDQNGDGRSDILMQGVGAKDSYLVLSNGSGFEAPLNISTLYAMGSMNNWRNDRFEIHILDHNGDGLDDVIVQSKTYKYATYLLTAKNDKTDVAFNDILQISGLYGSDSNDWLGDRYKLHILDQNGDGLDDILLQAVNASYQSNILLSTGKGFENITQISGSYGTILSVLRADYSRIHIVDINGDGRDDILFQGLTTSRNNYALISKSEGFEWLVTSNSFWGMNKADWAVSEHVPHFLDQTGNGWLDILFQGINSSDNTYRLTPTVEQLDLITKITTSRGSDINITYRPMTEEEVYTKTAFSESGIGAANETKTQSVYPQMDYQGAMLLVSQVQTDDGIGGTRTKDYSYTGAKIDLARGSYLGFATKTISDSDRDTKKTITYLQDFPQTGYVASERLDLFNGVPVEELINTWQVVSTDQANELPIDPADPTDVGTWVESVLLKESLVKRFEINGATPPVAGGTIGSGGGLTALPTYALSIAEHATNYNVKQKLIAANLGWDETSPVEVSVTIDTGVVLGGNSNSAYAIDFSGLPAGSTASLENNGVIVGYYGRPNGASGGHALKTSVPLIITNNGSIYAGGGAGSKGSNRTFTGRTGRMGHGEGAGDCMGGTRSRTCTVVGGRAGRGAGWYSSGNYYSSGTNGTNGTYCSVGNNICGGYFNAGRGGSGGNGGSFGMASTRGGAAGIVFNGYSLITFSKAGFWLGRISNEAVPPPTATVVSAPAPDTTLATFDILLDGHSQNVSIKSLMEADVDWNEADEIHITVTVAENIIIGSSTTSEYAIDFTGLPTGSQLRLVNNGFIVGKSGTANKGSGGHALKTDQALEIYNGGFIYGGSGAGNKGSNKTYSGIEVGWRGGSDGSCSSPRSVSATSTGGNGGRGAGWYSSGQIYHEGLNGSNGSFVSVGSNHSGCSGGVVASGYGNRGIKGSNFGVTSSSTGALGYAINGYSHVDFKIEGIWAGQVVN